jgi:hypothetical protein
MTTRDSERSSVLFSGDAKKLEDCLRAVTELGEAFKFKN